MPTLRHILSIFAGSRTDDPIRTRIKQLCRCHSHNRRQRSIPIRITARQSPRCRLFPNWMSLKRCFVRPQSADSRRMKPRIWSNPIDKVTNTIDTSGPTTVGPNWTAWDDDTAEDGLEDYGNEATTHTFGCPKATNRPVCHVPNNKPLPPIPPSSAKEGRIRVSHTPLTPLDTYIKSVQPLTRSSATSKCNSFQNMGSDASSWSLRSSTPGLTDSSSGYSSASASLVSTRRSGSPTFTVSSNCTRMTTLLQTPPPFILPKDSYPIPIYRPVFRPASPYPHTIFSAPGSHLPARHAC